MEHGTRSSYVENKCRCDECRDANRVYQNQRDRQRYAYTQEHGLPDDVEHGASAYVNWGCRCEICTKAHAVKTAPYVVAHRERQRAKKESA